jgi:hypothetical protein
MSPADRHGKPGMAQENSAASGARILGGACVLRNFMRVGGCTVS